MGIGFADRALGLRFRHERGRAHAEYDYMGLEFRVGEPSQVMYFL